MKLLQIVFVAAEHVLCCQNAVSAKTSCLNPIANGLVGQEYDRMMSGYL